MFSVVSVFFDEPVNCLFQWPDFLDLRLSLLQFIMTIVQV